MDIDELLERHLLQKKVLEKCDLNARTIQYLHQNTEIFNKIDKPPTTGKGNWRKYSLADLITFKIISTLIKQGVSYKDFEMTISNIFSRCFTQADSEITKFILKSKYKKGYQIYLVIFPEVAIDKEESKKSRRVAPLSCIESVIIPPEDERKVIVDDKLFNYIHPLYKFDSCVIVNLGNILNSVL